MTGSPDVRWATAADLRALYGDTPMPTVRARVALIDGEPVGAVGWRVRDGHAFVFSTVKEPLKKHRRLIVREARRAMRDLGGIPAVCVADPEIPGASRFLERLGWRRIGRREGQEVFVWQTPRQ